MSFTYALYRYKNRFISKKYFKISSLDKKQKCIKSQALQLK